MSRHLIPLALALVLPLPAVAAKKKPVEAPDMAAVAAQLRDAALASDAAYEELRELTDTIGQRLSGTAALGRAVQWAAAELREDGLTVTLEPVTVPRWTRGTETAALMAPLSALMQVLALGGSVSTPANGLDAEVLVVTSFDDLAAHAAEAPGRIVVWDVPFTTYGQTVAYRYAGATEASKVGALASLVRSVTPVSLYTPHTGMQRYGDGVDPIPAAAITVEDAERLHRLQDAGLHPRVSLRLDARDAGVAPSHNVVGELRGRELPDEIVVLGCHLDSWDVGQGAQDDGAGCVTVMEAVARLAALPVAPRRTVRVVLYTNEENGLAGGRAYGDLHGEERIVAALEDDTGSGAPLGFGVSTLRPDGDDTAPDADRTARVIATLTPYLPWFAPLGADTLDSDGGGADIGPLMARGTIGLGLNHDMTGYWPVHHTEADTFDKVDPALVKKNVAAATLMAWILAEHPGALDGGAP
ncbi:MAG: M20/M25/M40 family metallo-hydrolase [Alphaproteobacteria bacterium]|nr:M20/M25/M40 family metallo-hydrolase [Alphaproteobacteria bacterium]